VPIHVGVLALASSRGRQLVPEWSERRVAYGVITERLMAAWLAEAERALASNASTVAVLPMRDILRPDGYLAGLQARGYVVEEP